MRLLQFKTRIWKDHGRVKYLSGETSISETNRKIQFKKIPPTPKVLNNSISSLY